MSSALEHLFQEDLYRVPAPVVIILNQPWHKILEEEKALLAKILASVRINIDSVLIRAEDRVTLETLQATNPARVLIFGSTVSPEIQAYERLSVNGISVVRADALGLLDENRKKNLWVALKQMFAM
jgi:hypothetical protein